MRKTMISLLTTIALGFGCNNTIEPTQNPINTDITIEGMCQKLTLRNLDNDFEPDVLIIERKCPSPYSSPEPRRECFVEPGHMSQMPMSNSGTVYHVIEPSFFKNYSRLFSPQREFILQTYR